MYKYADLIAKCALYSLELPIFGYYILTTWRFFQHLERPPPPHTSFRSELALSNEAKCNYSSSHFRSSTVNENDEDLSDKMIIEG
jgi:hypothetical protein